MCVWSVELANIAGCLGIWTLFRLQPFISAFRNEPSGKLLHLGDICKMSSFRLRLATVPCEAVTLLTQLILDQPGKLGSSDCLIPATLPTFADSDIWNVN